MAGEGLSLASCVVQTLLPAVLVKVQGLLVFTALAPACIGSDRQVLLVCADLLQLSSVPLPECCHVMQACCWHREALCLALSRQSAAANQAPRLLCVESENVVVVCWGQSLGQRSQQQCMHARVGQGCGCWEPMSGIKCLETARSLAHLLGVC